MLSVLNLKTLTYRAYQRRPSTEWEKYFVKARMISPFIPAKEAVTVPDSSLLDVCSTAARCWVAAALRDPHDPFALRFCRW